MLIIGCDFHPQWQQVAWLDTGDRGNQRAEAGARQGRSGAVYRQLPAPALIGLEATGNCQWFVDLSERVWGMKCGSAMRRRSGPVMCASRRTTGGTRATAEAAGGRTVSAALGAGRGSSAICGSC